MGDRAAEGRVARLEAARLYGITPELPPPRLLELVDGWLAAGVPLVQLRAKTLPRGELLELARNLAHRCHRAGALLLVDDHLDVALLADADGVHLGEEDLPIGDARRVIEEQGVALLVGASAATPEAGRTAAAAGADYLGVGPAYATPIKAEKRPIGPGGVAGVQAAVGIPVFAIGGVDVGRIGELRAHGVGRVCVIRALSGPDPRGMACRLLAALR
jgi:thiamine-phosphate pyrophosphorylase